MFDKFSKIPKSQHHPPPSLAHSVVDVFIFSVTAVAVAWLFFRGLLAHLPSRKQTLWYFHCTVSKKKHVKQDLVNFSQTSPVKSTAWEICTDTVNKSQPYPVTKKHRRTNMYIHAFSFYCKFLHTCNLHCKNIIGKQTCYSSPNKWNLFFWEFLLFCRNTCDFLFSLAKRYVND